MPSLLTSDARKAYDRMASDFARVFGARFVALVANPHGAAAAFVQTLTPADLDALSPLAETWHRDSLATPLVMTPDEFRRSLDAFPAEYQTLLDHHVVIAGTAPFDGIRVQPGDLRRACEAQARGHLIHLRQGWIQRSAHHDLAALVEASAAPLRSILLNLSRLHDESPGDDAELAVWANRVTGMSESLLRDVLSLTDAPQRSPSLVPRMPEYLDACQRLWAYIDSWRAQ